jgi:hypothetical protein
VTVVFIQGFGTSLWSIEFDAASKTWGTAAPLPGPDGGSPTIVQTRSGEQVHLLSISDPDSADYGIYARQFDSASVRWGPVERIPGTGTARGGGPATVDENGGVTVFWESLVGGLYSVQASRREGGVWQGPVQVLAPWVIPASLLSFGHASVNSAGDVLGVVTRREGDLIRLYAMRYAAGTGWLKTENPYTVGGSGMLTTRSRVAFYEGARAVATVLGRTNGIAHLTSVWFDGSSWSPAVLDLPQDHQVFLQEIVADDGEALLVYQPTGGPFGLYSQGSTVATWLRAPVPGDLNSDCAVGLGDLLALFASWGVCGDPCPADLSGDDAVDFLDLSMLLSNWSPL